MLSNAPVPNRKIRDRERRNNDILDAAEHLFSTKGYQLATMEEVARDAGLSVGTLYNLFEDKSDLYAQVAARLGKAIIERFRPLVRGADPEQAVLDAIRLRLYNYTRDRLFFQPFYFPAYLGIQPEPPKLGDEVNRLHLQYEDLIEKIFDHYRRKAGFRKAGAVRMAAYLEGILTAFMGYWSGPVQSDTLANVARQMRDMLLRGMNIAPPPEAPANDNRSVYITRYDLDRLYELIDVVRAFGRRECLPAVDALAGELHLARVTHPREVPPDVVTMNARVRIVSQADGTEQICALVFPKDAARKKENISILHTLGMGMFGRRAGDVFSVGIFPNAVLYRVEEILYQPEAAGDYHL